LFTDIVKSIKESTKVVFDFGFGNWDFGCFYFENIVILNSEFALAKQIKKIRNRTSEIQNILLLLHRESGSSLLQYFYQFSRGFEPGDPI